MAITAPGTAPFSGTDSWKNSFNDSQLQRLRSERRLRSYEISPEDLWYAKDEMTVGNGLEHFFTQIFPKFHHPLLMTWWTEMAAFAWKSQQNFVTAVSTPDACKAIMKDAAIEVAINHLSHIGPEKAILLGKALIVELFQRFKMVFNALVILRSLGIARTIYWGGVGHGRFSLQRGSKNARRYIL